MTTPTPALTGALAHLEHRWGHAAVRLGSGDSVRFEHGQTAGATALAPAQPVAIAPAQAGAVALVQSGASAPVPWRMPGSAGEKAVSTGFPALDALLASGGLAGEAHAVLRGGATSGKTTLALRLIAEAQAQGAVAAYLDLGRTLDPLEAVARGVDLAWLLVLRAADATEGLRLAGALLGGRTVDLLVVDLPDRLAGRQEILLRRLAARARQVRARLVVLEPLDLASSLHGALAETSSLRLELERCAWIRVGRDVVGQRTLVTVAKDRAGAPGRRAEIEILYADEGERGRGIASLLDAGLVAGPGAGPDVGLPPPPQEIAQARAAMSSPPRRTAPPPRGVALAPPAAGALTRARP